jgi:hypothetical protein
MEPVYNSVIKNEELSRIPYDDAGNCICKAFLMTGWYFRGNGTLLMNYNAINQS